MRGQTSVGLAAGFIDGFDPGSRVLAILYPHEIHFGATGHAGFLHRLLEREGAGVVFLEDIEPAIYGDLPAVIGDDVSRVEIWAMIQFPGERHA